MKIIHQSPTQLMIEDRPWLLGLCMIAMAVACLAGSAALFTAGEGLGGAFLALVGGGLPLLIAGLMVQRVRLTFDRATGQLTRTRRSVLGLTRTAYPLPRLSRASVGVSYGDDGKTYRLELKLADPEEMVPFTTYYTTGGRPEQLCNAVNAWLGAGGVSA